MNPTRKNVLWDKKNHQVHHIIISSVYKAVCREFILSSLVSDIRTLKDHRKIEKRNNLPYNKSLYQNVSC